MKDGITIAALSGVMSFGFGAVWMGDLHDREFDYGAERREVVQLADGYRCSSGFSESTVFLDKENVLLGLYRPHETADDRMYEVRPGARLLGEGHEDLVTRLLRECAPEFQK